MFRKIEHQKENRQQRTKELRHFSDNGIERKRVRLNDDVVDGVETERKVK